MKKKYKVILEKQYGDSVLVSIGCVSDKGSTNYEPIAVFDNASEIEIFNPDKLPVQVSEKWKTIKHKVWRQRKDY